MANIKRLDILKLRIEKWWFSKVVKHFWKDIPFEIAYTDIADSYSDYPNGIILAEFNCNNKHYIIYQDNKYLI